MDLEVIAKLDEICFFAIPGISRYGISLNGDVLHLGKMRMVKGSTNPAGYINHRVLTDDSHMLTIGKHRLMALAFIPLDGDPDGYVVNHKNGMKSDNAIDNLEWVTYQGNAEHAGSMGLTEKCIPISVRDIRTGVVTQYPSATEYSRRYGMTKDAVLWRIRSDENRVFPEGKQYRRGHSKDPWKTPITTNPELFSVIGSNPVLVKWVLSGRVNVYPSITEASKGIGVKVSTLSEWLRLQGMPVLPGFVQVKLATDATPWREVVDPYLDYEVGTGKRVVKTLNTATNKVTIYGSVAECAEKCMQNVTTIHYRLRTNRKTPWDDGLIYRFYSDSF